MEYKWGRTGFVRPHLIRSVLCAARADVLYSGSDYYERDALRDPRGLIIMPMKLFRLFLLILGVTLAACDAPPTPELPTVIALPTAEPTPTPFLTNTPQPTATPTPTPVPVGRFAVGQRSTGTIRIVHLGAETGPVDLYIDGANINRNLAYPNNTGITPIAAGSYTLTAALTGSDPQAAPLVMRDFTVYAGESKLILLVGTADAPNLTVYNEDVSPSAADQSRVNFINAVPRLPDATVQLDGVPVTVPLAFDREATAFAAKTGSANVIFENNGTPYASVTATLLPRTLTTFVLIGSASAVDALQVLAFETPLPGETLLRAGNISESVRNIRVEVDGESITDALESTRFTERITRASGTIYVSVFDSTAPDVALIRDQGVELPPDTGVTLAFMGNAEAPLLLPVVQDTAAVRPDFSRMTFVNALPTTPMIEIGLGMDIFSQVAPLAYGAASQPIEIMREPYDFYAQAMGLEERVEVADGFIVEPGRHYIFFVTGRTDSQPVVISDAIPIDESLLGVDIDATPQPFADSPLRLRFVNMLASQQPITVSVLNQVVAEQIPFGGQSGFIPFTGQELVVTAVDVSGNIVLSETRLFSPDAHGEHSLYIGGRIPASLLLVPDSDRVIDSNFPAMRLINLTNDPNHSFKVMISSATIQPLPAIGTPSSARPSLPVGVTTLINATYGGTASGYGLVNAPGTYNLLIVDGNESVAQTLYSVTLQANTAYDLVTNELFDTGTVQAYLITYPQP